MASLADFIARVVPWPGAGAPGLVNMHWKVRDAKTGGTFWGGRPQNTVSSFVDLTKWAVGHPAIITDIYFCLSLQAKAGRFSRGKPTVVRSAENAMALKAVWLDIDVKSPPKGYATIEEAINALKVFLKAAHLPWPSATVASGGGLHVYWISSTTLSVDEWRPYAEGLKAAALSFGLRCDAGITTDAARILRVPETFNYKTDPPKPVKLLNLAHDYVFADALKHIFTLSPSSPTTITATVTTGFDLSAFQGKKPSAVFAALDPKDSLAAGLHEDIPLAPSPIIKGCPFFKDAMITHGKDHSQPLWNLAILATTFWQNGEVFAHEISNGHPGYTADSTRAMFERKARERQSKKLGWPSCKAIAGEGCKLCATCPHFGQIKSPLHLALTSPPAPPGGMLLAQLTQSAATTALDLPAGYAVDPKTGWVCEVMQKEVVGQPPLIELAPLFMCQITRAWAQKGPDGLNFTVTTDKGNTKGVMLLLTDICNTNETIKALLKQSVKIYVPNEGRLRRFFMSYFSKLTEAQEALASPPYGWYVVDGKKRGFCYGGVIIKDDGTEVPSGVAQKLRRDYTPTGDIDPWFTAFKLVNQEKRLGLDVMMAAAFAAPLMFATGEYSGMLCPHGESGSHKSSAMKVALAVWGHPKRSKEITNSTNKSVMEKMGILHNLPICWDEIKDKGSQEHLYKTVFSTEGIVGSRLTSDIEFRERGEWQTLILTASNHSFMDFVAQKNQTTTAALYRIFEFEIPKADDTRVGAIVAVDASRVFAELENNYGIMGMRYAKVLASDPKWVDTFVYDWTKKMSALLQTRQPERFWISIVSTILAGAELANKVGCAFDVPAMQEYLVAQYLSMRSRLSRESVEGGTEHNVMNILTGFLRDATQNSVWTQSIPMGRGKPKAVTILHGPTQSQDRGVYVQWAVDPKLLRFSKKKLREYLTKQDYPSFPVISGLERNFGATQEYINLCSGTGYSSTQEDVIVVPVAAGSPLVEQLYKFTNPDTIPADMLVPAPGRAVPDLGTVDMTVPEVLGVVDPPPSDALAAGMAQAKADMETVKNGTEI